MLVSFFTKRMYYIELANKFISFKAKKNPVNKKKSSSSCDIKDIEMNENFNEPPAIKIIENINSR